MLVAVWIAFPFVAWAIAERRHKQKESTLLTSSSGDEPDELVSRHISILNSSLFRNRWVTRRFGLLRVSNGFDRSATPYRFHALRLVH